MKPWGLGMVSGPGEIKGSEDGGIKGAVIKEELKTPTTTTTSNCSYPCLYLAPSSGSWGLSDWSLRGLTRAQMDNGAGDLQPSSPSAWGYNMLPQTRQESLHCVHVPKGDQLWVRATGLHVNYDLIKTQGVSGESVLSQSKPISLLLVERLGTGVGRREQPNKYNKGEQGRRVVELLTV